MKDKVEFWVEGSSHTIYTVSFTKRDGFLWGSCTCTAGEYGNWCKHRLGILKGETKKLVSENAADVDKVVSWLPGTPLESALRDSEAAEQRAEQAKREFTAAKKRLSIVMMSGKEAE